MSCTNVDLYRKLCTIRAAELYIQEHYYENEMKCPMHMSMGQEAVAVGVCAALGERAQTFCSYRSHAVYLARTDDVDGFFAELYGAGPNWGRAGSMHIAQPALGHYLSSGIVGTQIAPALGMAYANKRAGNDKVAVAFFGDGATNEGAFWESLNLAVLWKLPVVFVMVDNGLAVHTAREARDGIEPLVLREGHVLYMRAEVGVDARVVANMLLAHERETYAGPAFFQFRVHRYLEHVGVNKDYDAGYRFAGVGQEWRKRDPLLNARTRLRLEEYSEKTIQAIYDAQAMRVERAAGRARTGEKALSFTFARGVYR